MLYPAHKQLLKELVATANKVKSTNFMRAATFGDDVAIFHGPTGSVQLRMPENTLDGLGAGYVLTKGNSCMLTQFTWDAVARNFTPPLPPLPPLGTGNITHQTINIYGSNHGNVVQGVTATVGDTETAKLIASLREAASTLPAADKAEVLEQADNIECEMKSAEPRKSSLKASFSAIGPVADKSTALLTIVNEAAKTFHMT